MKWVPPSKTPKASEKTPAVVSHTALALVKKGYSPRAAWNIARAHLTKHGYLKGPYNEKDRVNPKMTRKGQKASMRHANEPGGGDKFKKFSKKFSKIVEGDEQERTFELIEINDLRPIDWYTGKRVPLSPGMGSICQRCGKEHAVVWKVHETTPGRQRVWCVGSGCGPKILAGWSPDGAVIKTWLNKDKVQALVTALKREIRKVKKFADTFKGKATPEPDRTPSKYTLRREQGLDDVTITGVRGRVLDWKKTGDPLTPDDWREIRFNWIKALARSEGFNDEFSHVAAWMDRGTSEDEFLTSTARSWSKVVGQAKKLGVLGTMRDLTETHHRRDGKFATKDAAHIVVKDGKRFRVVRQLRLVKNRRLNRDRWSRDGDELVRAGDIPERYMRITGPDVTSGFEDAASALKYRPKYKMARETAHIVRMSKVSDEGWDDALALAAATFHSLFSDPWDDDGLEGAYAVKAARESGVVYLMKRVW